MDREARAREQSLERVVEMGPTKEGEIMEGFMRLKLAEILGAKEHRQRVLDDTVYWPQTSPSSTVNL